MSGDRQDGQLSDDQSQMLDRICYQFENALRSGEATSIESQMTAAARAIQTPLFLELLKIELRLEMEAGHDPVVQNYEARFPDRHPEIDQAFTSIPELKRQSPSETDVPETAMFSSSPKHLPGKDPGGSIIDLAVGESVGPYTLLKPIGQGGMGSVWMAEQSQPVRRSVALKIIKAGMDSREVIARFEAERQALALMDHPNVAKVFDAGTTGNGRPFFVMELVEGLPITDFCDQNHLDAGERLELFRAVCHAVQHAHQKGIIHRDIKPSNILVAQQDGVPAVKVIDFGLAKAIDQRLTEKTMFTAHGQIVGTPAYMSPEQADIGGLDIDTRTDVYSLGVVLYEILTGVTPIDLEKLRSAGYSEIQRMIREHEPPAMSNRLISLGESSHVIAGNRATDSKRLAQWLRGDLDLIVKKALEKDRNRRYETPSSMAADIRRFLNDEAIEARPASASYRLKKLIRRNKTAVLATSVVALSLLLGTVVSVWQAVRATKARDAEQQQRKLADDALSAERTANGIAQRRLGQLENVNTIFASIFRDLDPSQEEKGGLPIRAQLAGRLDKATEMLDEEAVGDPLMVAKLQVTLSKTQRKLAEYDKARRLAEKALKIYEAHLGPKHRDTLEAVAALGLVHEAAGNFEDAISFLERAYNQRKVLLGPENIETLESKSLLAGTYGSAGQMKRGLELQNDAFETTQRILGRSHEQTINCLNRLAKQIWQFGEDEELAEKLWADLVERRTELYGERHYSTLMACGSWAVVCMGRGKYDKAGDILQRTREGLVKNVGPDHQMTIRMTGNLAFCYLDGGETEKGLKLLEETVAQLSDKLGEAHPNTLVYMNSLAYSYEQNDQLDKAIKLHEETFRLREMNLGPDHMDTLISQSNLAWCLRRNGQFQQSIVHYRKAVAGLKTQSGLEHPETLGCMNNLAWSLLQGEQFAEAEGVLREFLPIHKEKHPEHWKTYRAQYWFGAVLMAQKKWDEAAPEILAGYQGMKSREDKMSETSKIHLVEAIESLIKLYTARDAAGDSQNARKWQAILESNKGD